MHANRFVPAQSSAVRKSRMEGKPSMLPKPRRPSSTDRLSTELRRPSTAGHRSSSAEPPRATFGSTRLSREASATKLPLNGRSRSQQGDRFGQSSMTPLRSSHYGARPTTTPLRTPSGERTSRSWQTSLERALAFVTAKDQRPISTVAWQRASVARVQEALGARGLSPGALVRPLTIARFVDITGALLGAITADAKLNNDNYVTKLPHLSKRLLYPGAVSKSWLRTVNTLHAFPHALALIAYLLDLVNHIETPVLDEWLYVGQDELACLRRDYLWKCWIRFQDPDPQFEDLTEEYLQQLKVLLGNDEDKIAELQLLIKKYEACMEDEVEVAARADEARRAERREALGSALKAARGARRAARADSHALTAAHDDRIQMLKQLDVDIERATTESEVLKRELEQQSMSVDDRTRLLDEVDYALRVHDSKRALAEQIAKMVLSKETELALWQKTTLGSCVEYKQGLIHLSAQFPHLATLAIDEKELMQASCGAAVGSAVEALRTHAATLAQRRADHTKQQAALARKTAHLLEETKAKISEIQSCIVREQQALDSESSKESAEASACALELQRLNDRMEALRGLQEDYHRTDAQLAFWEKQNHTWLTKLSELKEYIRVQTEEANSLLQTAVGRRVELSMNSLKQWHKQLAC